MAQFQKGQPRPANAGRKLGSKNKKKFAKVAQVLAEQDLDLVGDILDLLAHGDLRDKDKLDGMLQLLSYCQAKPKDEGPQDDEEDDEAMDDLDDEQLLKIVGSDRNP